MDEEFRDAEGEAGDSVLRVVGFRAGDGGVGDADLFEVFGEAALLELAGPVFGGGRGFGGGVEVAGDGVGEVLLRLHGMEFAGGDVGLKLSDCGCGEVGEEGVVLGHEFVGDGHEFAVHLGGGLVDADGVVEGFGHFLDAVEAFEDGGHEDDLGGLAEVALEVAAAHEVELLVGAAEFHVGLEGDGVIPLGDGIEELVQGDGLFGLKALVEVFAFEHLGDGELGLELDEVVVGKFVEPLGVVADLGFFRVEEFEDLVFVGFGVAADLFAGEGFAGDVAACGVADEGGGVTDEEDDGVAEGLEVFEFADEDGVAEVEVGSGGVEAGLDAEGGAGVDGALEAGGEVGGGEDLGGAFGDEIELGF